MTKSIFLFRLVFIFSFIPFFSDGQPDYSIYHQQVIAAEKFIANEKYQEALQVYEGLFNDYEFVFLRDYKIASQLALQIGDQEKALQLLKKGILAGWTMKSIKKNNYLSPIRDHQDWKALKKDYPKLRQRYESTLNENLQKEVKKMFSKDQWKALAVFLTFSSKAQDRNAEKKFAPQSEKHMEQLHNILFNYGHPGEKITGNNYWASTILGHHNSISQEYVKRDSLYPKSRPLLAKAVRRGEMSPYSLAVIDEWRGLVEVDRGDAVYGFIEPPTKAQLAKTNERRAKANLRSIETRNKLVDIENSTGMNFYFKDNPWEDGKILIRP